MNLNSESGYGEEKPHGDSEYISFTIYRIIAGSLPYIRIGSAYGDVAHPEWFTHSHCAWTHLEDSDHKEFESSEEKPNSDHEWTNSVRHVTAGSLPCIQIGAIYGD